MEKRRSDRKHVCAGVLLSCILPLLASAGTVGGNMVSGWPEPARRREPPRFAVYQGQRQIVIPSLVLGSGIYVINLPYVLLMFSSSFFRQRFHAWLGAEPSGVPPALP